MMGQKTTLNLPNILKLAQTAGMQRYMVWRGGADESTLKSAADMDRLLSDALDRIREPDLRERVGQIVDNIIDKADMQWTANDLARGEAPNIIKRLLEFKKLPENLFLKQSEVDELAALAEKHGYQGVKESLASFTGGIIDETSISNSANQAATASAKQQAEGIKGALGNFFSGLSGMSGTNKAALGVSAAAAVHGASKVVQRDEQGKRRIHFGRVFQVGVALAAGAATIYGQKQGGNTIDGTLAAGKQVVGKFTEMLANLGAAGVGQTRS